MDISSWEYYSISELFSSFERGKVHSQNSLPQGNDYFYVGAKKDANGVMCRCGYDANLISKGNCLVFICNGEGSVGYCNYMDRDFMASGDLIMAYADFLNPRIGLFMASLLDLERPKYSFGRKYGSHVKATKILLPTKDGSPDWQYMESFIQDNILPQLPKKAQKVWLQKYDIKPQKQEAMKLNTDEWKWFEYSDLFNISGSKTTPKEELESYGKGKYPYVTTQAVNNGVENFYNYSTEKGGVLTVDSAVLGFCSYQEKDFSASDHVEVLTPKFKMNRYIALFLSTIINREQYRYSYGRKCSQVKLRSSRIKLPATPSGDPDWQFMEDYIKSLPYSKNLEPSDPNEKVDELMEVKRELIKLQQAVQAQKTAQIINYGTINNDNSKHITIK